MAALTKPSKPIYFGTPPATTSLLVDAAAVIYEGSAVTINAGTQGARQLNTADNAPGFVGFAARTANNTVNPVIDQYAFPATDGVMGSASVEVYTRGKIQLTVAAGGVLANNQTDVGLPVYTSDGATFTGSNAAGALKVGYIDQWISSGVYAVNFYGQEMKQT